MNRHFRRLQQFGKRFSSKRSTAAMSPNPGDVVDPRAKNTGHGKKTADKWNQ